MSAFYDLKRLDIFKDRVSLPGIGLNYQSKSTDDQFNLFDDEYKATKEDRGKSYSYCYILKDSTFGHPENCNIIKSQK
jgi:hypothetical protein